MAVVINGDTGISPVTASGTSASVDGMTVGRGGGEVSTNTAVGASALNANTTGSFNTAVGYNAAILTTSGGVTAFGSGVLAANTTGNANTGLGGYDATVGIYGALSSNTTGSYNIAVGTGALRSNTTASNNTAVGYQAGYTSSVGLRQSYFGSQAGYYMTDENTSVGYRALYGASGSTGYYNVAVGRYALNVLTTGQSNVAIGDNALQAHTSGIENTAVGYQALNSNTTASYNTAVGRNSLVNCTTGTHNTVIGHNSGDTITTGTKNTILGRYNGNQGGLDIRTASNYIVLSDGDGNPRLFCNDVGKFGIGTTSVSGAYFTVQGAFNGGNICTFNNSGSSTPYGPNIQFTATAPNNTSQFFLECSDTVNGKLSIYSNGTVNNRTGTYAAYSDIKLKQDVVDAGSQWNDIKAVRVRKFRLKDDVLINPDAKPFIGVIAQELEATSAGLIDDTYDKEGVLTKSVKYSILYMKAVKALQEAMERIESLEAKVNALETK
jgi:hypothetical protein